MKKRIILVSAALVLVLCSAAALAANNGSGESLVSLSYLTNTFLPGLMQQAENKLEPLEQVYDQASIQLDQKAASYLAQASGTEGSAVLYSACFADTPLHRGDILALSTGAGFLLREGSAKVTHNGTVVDITTGSTLPSGGKLNINHRYLVGEETSASFYISSEAATAAVEGFYTSGLRRVEHHAVCRCV